MICVLKIHCIYPSNIKIYFTGTHNVDLKEFQCEICLARFSYKSTLNKHTRKEHTPYVETQHACFVCNTIYDTPYQVRNLTVFR